MTLETDNRDRLITAGCVVLLVIALLLAAAAILVSIAVQGFFDRPEEPPDEVLVSKSLLTEYRLGIAIRDGSLTVEETDYAAGDARWSSERDNNAVRVTVDYPADDVSSAGCYRFTLPHPLNDRTQIERKRLPHRAGDSCAIGPCTRRCESTTTDEQASERGWLHGKVSTVRGD